MGAVTFGGGMAMMPIMERELIAKRHWITDEELLDYYAIGQSTPGIIAVNVSTFVGTKRAGWVGGVVATSGMVFPSIIIICLIAGLLKRASAYPLALKALRGVNVAVASLLTYVVITFSKKTVKNIFGAACLAVSFTLIFFFKVPSYFIIIGAAATGIVKEVLKNKAGKKQ